MARSVRQRACRRKALGVAKGYRRRLRGLGKLSRYDLVYCLMYGAPLGGDGLERADPRRAPRLVYDVEDNVMVSFAERAGDHPNPMLKWLRGTASTAS